MDGRVNFAYGKIATAPSPAASGTTFSLESGQGARFPNPAVVGAYNVVIKASGEVPISTNAEIVRVTTHDPAGDAFTITRTQESTSARTIVVGDEVYLGATDKIFDDIEQSGIANMLQNGNFINNSTNGYGGTPDDWTSSNANPVQGGFPTFTKQQLIDLLGINDGDIEGLWNLTETSGNAADLSSNNYALTDTNTVLYSPDGLMGNARDLEADNSEYLTIADASCPNLEISGSQTWWAAIKMESLADYRTVMAKTSTVNTLDHRLIVDSSGLVYFQLTGLTTNAQISSDVKLEVGKWYLIVARYDSANTTLSLTINGVKKSVTASGSANDSNGDFSIGRLGGTNNWYFDGLIQNVGVLSVALTDDQIKRLFAATLYKGLKIRASSQYATMSQTLDPTIVERLKGKTVTIRASVYQSQASDVSLYTNENGSTVSFLTPPTTYGQWSDISLTVTLSSTLRTLEIGIQSRAAVLLPIWIKEVAIYEGSLARPFSHSPRDWARFPRLLRLDIPLFSGGKPYQYEEAKEYSYVPSISLGYASPPTGAMRWSFSGKKAFIKYVISSNVATSNNAGLNMQLPIIAGANTPAGAFGLCAVYDNGAYQTVPGVLGFTANSDVVKVGKAVTNAANGTYGGFTTSGNKGVEIGNFYEID